MHRQQFLPEGLLFRRPTVKAEMRTLIGRLTVGPRRIVPALVLMLVLCADCVPNSADPALNFPTHKTETRKSSVFSHNFIRRYFVFMRRFAWTAVKQLFSLFDVDG